MKREFAGLCFRCEHRVRNLEHKLLHPDSDYHPQPRCECGSSGSTSGCYMYRPVEPVITKPLRGDRRPRHAGMMLSARETGRLARDGELKPVLLHVNKREDVIVYDHKSAT